MDEESAANDAKFRNIDTEERKKWVDAAMRGQLSHTELALLLGIGEHEALKLISDRQEEWMDRLKGDGSDTDDEKTE